MNSLFFQRPMDIEKIPLIAGHPALDFVNTVEGRGSGTALDYLADYKKLADWCSHAGIIPPSQHADIWHQAEQHPVVAARTWREAMKLRDCLNRILLALVDSRDPESPAIAAYNETLQQAFANRRLLPSASGHMDWTWRRGSSALKVPLWEIALAAADLITDEGNERIKICANGPCDWMFLDTSRNGQRRWCRMAVCGNTSKVRRFRERQRGKQ